MADAFFSSSWRILEPHGCATVIGSVQPVDDWVIEYVVKRLARKEIRQAKGQHKEWVRGQLSGLPEHNGALTEWIKLTRGQRPDLAAELAGAGISAAEAGLRLGYGGRIDNNRYSAAFATAKSPLPRRSLRCGSGVDAAGVDQVGGDGDVEASSCPARLFDDAHAAREVGLALLRLDGDVSCNDDHGYAPLLTFSCWAGPARCNPCRHRECAKLIGRLVHLAAHEQP
jgi:hypothetical protein